MSEPLFEKGIIDYADSLDDFIYKHTISKAELIRKIIGLGVEPIDLTELSIEFDEVIKKNTVNEKNEALWSWKFSLLEWDVQYQFVTKEEFIFERVLNLAEVRQIVQTRRDRLDEIIKHKIMTLSPQECEIFVGKLFGNLPQVSDIEVTTLSNDGGIDFKGIWKIEGISEQLQLLGQVKRYTNTKIGGPDIQSFLGTLTAFQPNNTIGIFVSTSGFNKNAKEAAKKAQYNIELYDMPRLIETVHKTSTGTNLIEIELKDIDELFWDNLND